MGPPPPFPKLFTTSFDNIAYNIAGNNADNKVDISDSSASYNVARSCGLDPHTGIRLNPERERINDMSKAHVLSFL